MSTYNKAIPLTEIYYTICSKYLSHLFLYVLLYSLFSLYLYLFLNIYFCFNLYYKLNDGSRVLSKELANLKKLEIYMGF